MLVRYLGLPSVFAALASAFMIPSTVSLPEAHGHGVDALNDFIVEQSQTDRLVRLECLECLFHDPENGYIPTRNVKSDLLLRFAISDSRNAIMLNGVDLLPLMDGRTSGVDSAPQPVAQQIVSGVSTDELERNVDRNSPTQRTIFYEATVQRGPVTDDDPDYSLILFDLKIKSLDDERVKLDKLTLRLLKGDGGRHRIIDILQIPGSLTGARVPTYAEEELSPSGFKFKCPAGPLAVFCRAKAAIENKIGWFSRLRSGCSGLGATAHDVQGEPVRPTWKIRIGTLMQPPDFAQDGADDVYRTDDFNQYYGHQHQSSKLRRFAHMLHAIISGFVIPVLVGIAAGVTASLLGMVVGTLVGWLWFKLVRGGKRGDASQRPQERELAVEQAEEVEKHGLLEGVDEEEPPPVYIEKE